MINSMAIVETENQAEQQPEQIPLDELATLRIQNAQLQQRILNDQISAAMVDFAQRHDLNLTEWQLNLRDYFLVRVTTKPLLGVSGKDECIL